MSIAGDLSDVVEGGAEPDPRRRARLAAVVVAVLLLAGTAWWLDHRERQRGFDRLIACVRQGQSAAADASARVSFMSGYIRPALSSGLPPEVETGLYRLVEQAAAEALPGLERAVAGCDLSEERAWHGGLKTARASYLDYLGIQVAVLRDTAEEGRQFYLDRPELARQRELAGTTLVEAAPDGDRARRAGSLLDGT